ncbi:MAG TPA: hypothetical protein VMU57_05695, partial [Edaphobacter sp.]|uniref:hypothetical protein n=1 Tax=Edaphobacter sp. TaxID=1934404 RepID=UPI002B72CF8D
GQVSADDMAAGRAEDIADKKDIHSKSLHGAGLRGMFAEYVQSCGRLVVVAFLLWHRMRVLL